MTALATSVPVFIMVIRQEKEIKKKKNQCNWKESTTMYIYMWHKRKNPKESTKKVNTETIRKAFPISSETLEDTRSTEN